MVEGCCRSITPSFNISLNWSSVRFTFLSPPKLCPVTTVNYGPHNLTNFFLVSVANLSSSPLSILSQRRSKTQTFTDLSLHCYNYRKPPRDLCWESSTSEIPNKAAAPWWFAEQRQRLRTKLQNRAGLDT
ncbi:hypothetical protein Peur_033558 [Populus x canadensis]